MQKKAALNHPRLLNNPPDEEREAFIFQASKNCTEKVSGLCTLVQCTYSITVCLGFLYVPVSYHTSTPKEVGTLCKSYIKHKAITS